jgi:RNA polymerase sigma factor (sigma-70 family)
VRDRSKDQALDMFLVASARLGDRRHFALLVERWDPKLRAHARRLLGDNELASDAVQESWTDIVRDLGRLREDRAFPVWAYRIVSRRCAKAIASLQHRRRIDAALAAEPEAAATETHGDGDSAMLHAAVQTLPPGQHAAVALHYFEELSVAETAVALNIPAGTVKTRLLHARRSLRARLEGDKQCEISTN